MERKAQEEKYAKSLGWNYLSEYNYDGDDSKERIIALSDGLAKKNGYLYMAFVNCDDAMYLVRLFKQAKDVLAYERRYPEFIYLANPSEEIMSGILKSVNSNIPVDVETAEGIFTKSAGELMADSFFSTSRILSADTSDVNRVSVKIM